MNEIRRREWPWIERLPLAEQEVALSREELRYALRWALAHPREELALIGPRLAHFYGSDHQPLADRPETPKSRAAVMFADAFFFAVLVLAVLGLPDTTRPLGAGLVLPATVFGITALHALVFFADPRYHVPVVPPLVVLAALGIRRVSAWLRGRA